MSLTFPTQEGPSVYGYPPPLGHPRRARPCRCETPLFVAHVDECIRCGHYPREIIDATFAERAREIASRGQRRRRLKQAA